MANVLSEKEQADFIKSMIRGQAAEMGLGAKMMEQVEFFRNLYEMAKKKGEVDQAAFLMALAYFSQEVQP